MKVDPAISNLSSGLATFFNTATRGSMAGLSSADTCIDYTNNVAFVLRTSQLPVLGLGLGVDFAFAWDNNNNNNNNNDKNPHLNFLNGTVLGDKEKGIRENGQGSRDKT